MDIDTEKLLTQAIFDGIRKGVSDRLTGYNSPLDEMLKNAIASRSGQMQRLLETAITECVGSDDFVNEIKAAVRMSLAKTLVQRFGGELEKQVNALKSDPATRARITVALDEIVKSKVS